MQEQTIVLAMDVSLSMRAMDVVPDRISAAQTAARAFVQALPNDVRIGVVSYAGAAQIVQPPTSDKGAVLDAIGRFQLHGIAMSLATLFPDDGIDVSSLDSPRASPHSRPPIDDRPLSAKVHPVVPGSDRSAAIVLLTDGQNLMGIDPMVAAQMAADYGIRVVTVGIGTPEGELLDLDGWKMRVRLDEDTLRRIANLTLGRYFHAVSTRELGAIYDDLRGRLVFEKKAEEVTVVFALLSGVLVLIASGLSMAWFGRPL